MRRSPWLRTGAPAIWIALAVAIAGCQRGESRPTPAGGNAPAPTVQVATVEKRDVSITSEWIGTLDGFVNAQIQPHVSGYLTRENYREGSYVHRGEVLFE